MISGDALPQHLRTMLSALCALAMGAALRLWFIHAFPQIQGDSLLYADIARNWLTHGIYGSIHNPRRRPAKHCPHSSACPDTPASSPCALLFLASRTTLAVLSLQVVIDLTTCLLIAGFVRKLCGPLGCDGRHFGWQRFVPSPQTTWPCRSPKRFPSFCVALGLYAFAAVLERPTLGMDAGPGLCLELRCAVAS